MAEVTQIKDEMPKAYEPGKVEQKWYQFWLDKGYFTPKIDPEKKPFVIIMPPPNVTGELHIGHALTATLEDIMARWHRMKGEPTLWLPGVDHAGIATQVVVEQMLAREGLDRHKLGREKTEVRIRQWAESRRRIIAQQHQRLGTSCDWTRERYTLDEGPGRAVRTAFVRLYHKGLIYRGERIINWCPRCATALSDLEVDHEDVASHLYYVRYPLAGGNGFITVATTRPETIMGDTAVAVNPEDERFQALVGKMVILPAVKRVIPIIADAAISLTFGTGAVKITPAHDPVDFEVAQRHGLALVNIINPNATMNENAGHYVGLDRFACREAILADLAKDGLLEKIEPYTHAVGHCQRCRTIVEPVASQQWFINTKPLAEPAIKAVVDGRITIIPSHFTKVYLNWMESIRDWCISRQLWWGHRIPVWYCRDCGKETVSVHDATSCGCCRSPNIEQDPDVLDTWFSSSLWPHSTLGWPDDSGEFGYFYPTTVMETAYDILFFWVARMIMMALEDTGDIPFRTVYLHGLIRDEKGEKMSKTRGNVLDPIAVLEKYGTDALRFALLVGTSPGNDSKLTMDKLEAGRNFANKLWNATRFVVRSLPSQEQFISQAVMDELVGQRPLEDHWILSRLSRVVSSVGSLMADFQFEEAERQIYDFLWSEFCDWYIELAKIRLHPATEKVPSPVSVLLDVLDTSLRLLHPYMPFVTEELWQSLKRRLPSDWSTSESIMVAPYPDADAKAVDPEAERVMEAVIEIVRAIRNARTQHKAERVMLTRRTFEDNPIEKTQIYVYDGKMTSVIASYSQAIHNLAKVESVVFLDSQYQGQPNYNTQVLELKETQVVINRVLAIDLETERKRLEKEIAGTQAEATRLEARLADRIFLSRAPAAVVDKERQKLSVLTDKLVRLREQLARG